MSELALSSLDLVIIAAYFAVVLFIGFWVARRTRSGEDLFLAGRRLPWAPIGFSLYCARVKYLGLLLPGRKRLPVQRPAMGHLGRIHVIRPPHCIGGRGRPPQGTP